MGFFLIELFIIFLLDFSFHFETKDDKELTLKLKFAITNKTLLLKPHFFGLLNRLYTVIIHI